MNSDLLSIKDFFIQSIDSFFNDEKVNISAIFLCIEPVNGHVSIAFDTQKSSDNFLKKWRKEGPDWYGADEFGEYNNNGADFLFPFYKEIDIENWYDGYWNAESDDMDESNSKIMNYNGDIVKIHFDSDSEYNSIIFDMVKRLVDDELKSIDFSKYAVEKLLRIGLQVFEDDLINVWCSSN